MSSDETPTVRDEEFMDGLAAAIYGGGDEAEWLTTADGSPNAASYEYARRAAGRLAAPDVTPTLPYVPVAERYPNPATDLDRLAIALMSEWERVEGPVSVSYVASFVDLARAALAHQGAPVDAGATGDVEGEPSDAVVDALAAEIHEAWEFQHDECDHGAYQGGHQHGEPYAMCRLSAARILRRRGHLQPGQQQVVVSMPLAAVLAGWRDGDDRGWEAEFASIEAEHLPRLDRLMSSIQTDGIIKPIHLGPDGRVWDGHHRLCAAERLAMETVPVLLVTAGTS